MNLLLKILEGQCLKSSKAIYIILKDACNISNLLLMIGDMYMVLK